MRDKNSELGLDKFSQKPAEEGLSLTQLSEAFAQLLGKGDDPYAGDAGAVAEPPAETTAPVDDGPACETTPRSILEAMLFVGLPGSQPLNSQQVAALMRGVRPAEIDDLVRELNDHYAATHCPYLIVSDAAGYRMTLRPEFDSVRERFLGRVRQARLSAAAIEVLAAVAYNEPLSGDQVARLRGTPSGHVLSQLVRRQLLRVERSQQRPRINRYYTTPRFLELFGLETLAELPRGQDVERL